EAAVSLAVLKEQPQWPSELDPHLPQAISAVVMKALEKQPQARFESARAMRLAVEAAVRPAEPDAVGGFLNALWPLGDPERVAMESLAGGRAEESSEPALESIISQGYDLPPGRVSTARPPHG